MRKVGLEEQVMKMKKKTPVSENPLVQEYGGENCKKVKESQKK